MLAHPLTVMSLVLLSASLLVPFGARAETLPRALARAYAASPVLNAQRAEVRATDENVQQALSGYRPRVQLQTDAGVEFRRERTIEESEITLPGPNGEDREISVLTKRTQRQTLVPRAAELSIEQNLFDAGRTRNTVRQAESQVLAARANLRNTEQNVLLDAVTAYMDVLRDQALLELQRNNVKLLEETLYQVRERYTAGQVTPTDVAQAEARLASGRAQVNLAQANLKASAARYRQVIGAEPRGLAPGAPLATQLLPPSTEVGTRTALAEHPAITAALHGVDVAELEVRVVKSGLYPQITLTGGLARRLDSETRGDRATAVSGTAQVTVPIYEGGETYARTRQAKETTGQRRAEAEVVRDEVRAAFSTAWGVLEAARAQIRAAQTQIEANEVALTGVREEARAGQRTTLDVLNAQQELLNARVTLATAQRDQVVASYALLSATGRLSVRALGLKVQIYEPRRHFDQVKDLKGGLRTPDGR